MSNVNDSLIDVSKLDRLFCAAYSNAVSGIELKDSHEVMHNAFAELLRHVRQSDVAPRKRGRPSKYGWRPITIRSPLGRRIRVVLQDTLTDLEFEDIAWRVSSGRSKNHKWMRQIGRSIEALPFNLKVIKWRLMK